MKRLFGFVAVGVLLGALACVGQEKKPDVIQYVDTPGGRWMVHDEGRPAPLVITPGTESTQDRPGTAPSDAVVLFDGKDLSRWTSDKGGPAAWVLKDGYMETVKGTGPIKSKDAFGSCQLHVEFAT
jgi:hypothetical protein